MKRRTEIERQAYALLAEAGVTGPPVDVRQLANALGYQVVFKFFKDDDLSGTVFKDADGTITLGINSFQAKVRQRFSIAHEMGHAHLHLAAASQNELFVDPPARVLFRDGAASSGTERKEIEANQFAAGLLMPLRWVVDEGGRLLKVNPRLSMPDVIDRLATRFDVSQQAIRFRLVTLGLIEPE